MIQSAQSVTGEKNRYSSYFWSNINAQSNDTIRLLSMVARIYEANLIENEETGSISDEIMIKKIYMHHFNCMYNDNQNISRYTESHALLGKNIHAKRYKFIYFYYDDRIK